MADTPIDLQFELGGEPDAGASITISPPSATFASGGSKTFTATVTGAADTSTSWEVHSGTGDLAGVGNSRTLTSSTVGEVVVRVTANADPSVYADATVTVTAVAEPGGGAVGLLTVSAGLTGDLYGGKTGTVIGEHWVIGNENIPIDPARGYSAEIRYRQISEPTSGPAPSYVGFVGIGADGVTPVDMNGAATTHTAQHLSMAISQPADGEWQTSKFYWQGNDVPAWGNVASSPGSFHPAVRYVRPCFAHNVGASGDNLGQVENDYVRWADCTDELTAIQIQGQVDDLSTTVTSERGTVYFWQDPPAPSTAGFDPSRTYVWFNTDMADAENGRNKPWRYDADAGGSGFAGTNWIDAHDASLIVASEIGAGEVLTRHITIGSTRFDESWLSRVNTYSCLAQRAADGTVSLITEFGFTGIAINGDDIEITMTTPPVLPGFAWMAPVVAHNARFGSGGTPLPIDARSYEYARQFSPDETSFKLSLRLVQGTSYLDPADYTWQIAVQFNWVAS